MLRLLFLSILTLTSALQWYSTRTLGEETKATLLSKGCFRGSYGVKRDLHLFNCQVEGLTLKPFAILSENSRLCVVEVINKEKVMKKINDHRDEVVVVAEENDAVIIGNVNAGSDLYPSICSRSDFEGAAENVYIVYMQPTAPQQQPLQRTTPQTGAPNPQIAALVNSVSSDNLMSVVRTLSDYFTRLSTSATAQEAVDWAANEYRRYGFEVEQQPFRSGYCNNIIATKRGVSSDVILIGSHIDSRSTSTTNVSLRAPGADDNGSGMAANLELARLIYETKITFQNTLVLAAFCGEEQGLYGSQYMAQQMKAANVRIPAMYNADMIGYACNNTITLTFDSNGVDGPLVSQCKAIVPDYLSMEYPIGENSGCCSDNGSFQNAGYPTVSFFECPGRTVVNPNYHRSTDLPETININQLTYVSKALYACALSSAVPL